MVPTQVVADDLAERDICAFQSLKSYLGIEYLALGKGCRCKGFHALVLYSGIARSS